ncbi:hypothetical protein C4K03_5510 [Pseudomonas synxantha]|uniref:Uncharacterized protein n=1 Tax=Pseudomonas synxantha TaxID=47883 RepID=A0A3G7UDZ2_9PSED|nr:hypothetical protein C4K03_5510 [Pseudomonas synxantha]
MKDSDAKEAANSISITSTQRLLINGQFPDAYLSGDRAF